MNAIKKKWSLDDTVGFLINAVITTGPLLGVTWFANHVSKDGPMSDLVYFLVAAFGIAVAGIASATAFHLAWRRSDRLLFHLGFGFVISLLFFVTFCFWWGDGFFRITDQIRI